MSRKTVEIPDDWQPPSKTAEPKTSTTIGTDPDGWKQQGWRCVFDENGEPRWAPPASDSIWFQIDENGLPKWHEPATNAFWFRILP